MRRQGGCHRGVDVLELGVAVGALIALDDLGIALQAVALGLQELAHLETVSKTPEKQIQCWDDEANAVINNRRRSCAQDGMAQTAPALAFQVGALCRAHRSKKPNRERLGFV